MSVMALALRVERRARYSSRSMNSCIFVCFVNGGREGELEKIIRIECLGRVELGCYISVMAVAVRAERRGGILLGR